MISWSLSDNEEAWGSAKEVNAVAIASYFGHKSIIEIFLRSSRLPCSSPCDALLQAAFRGFAEARHVIDVASCLDENENFKLPSDPFVDDFERARLSPGDDYYFSRWKDGFKLKRQLNELQSEAAPSLAGCVVFASLQTRSESNVREGASTHVALIEK